MYGHAYSLRPSRLLRYALACPGHAADMPNCRRRLDGASYSTSGHPVAAQTHVSTVRLGSEPINAAGVFKRMPHTAHAESESAPRAVRRALSCAVAAAMAATPLTFLNSSKLTFAPTSA